MASTASHAFEEEKLRERTSLLMRVYWQDAILKIGRELRLSYFIQIDFYWNMNHYQGALEIAKHIDDATLTQILSGHPSPHGVPLGGFQGKYYSLDEEGRLRLGSSQDHVRKNVRAALRKWSEKAYGVLQALVNKNGRAAYFELIDETERVLGYEFVPSYLLPRLAPMRLVFKTGSNKYPDWTMPSEIIPIVQEETSTFKRPAHSARMRTGFSEALLKQVRETDIVVSEVIEVRRNLNVAFEKHCGTPLFKQNEKATNDLRRPCSNEEEFNNRILSLGVLIDEMETTELSKRVTIQGEPGSINLLERILDERIRDYDKTPLKTLRMIRLLRSKRYPVHRDDPIYLNALSYLGFTELPPDWQSLWETVLRRYLDSLHALLSLLLRQK